MKDEVPATEERPILLHEDSSYAFKQLLSIIKDNDYSDLGNHATEGMGYMGLFSLAQVHRSVYLCLLCFNAVLSKLCPWFLQGVDMMKGLMDLCISYETVLSCLREKLGAKETELQELLAWKNV